MASALATGGFIVASNPIGWIGFGVGALMGASIAFALVFYTYALHPKICAAMPLGAALLVNGAAYIVVIYFLAAGWIIALQISLQPRHTAEKQRVGQPSEVASAVRLPKARSTCPWSKPA